MDQEDLFDEEGNIKGASEGDELQDLRGRSNSSITGNARVLLLVGLLLVAGAYAVNTFLLKKEEPAAPPPTPVKIPIKGAPVMGVVTGIKAVPAPPKEIVVPKEEAKAKGGAKAEIKKGEIKPEGKKTEGMKIAKKEETPKPKPEVMAEKPATKEAAKPELKKTEAKPEAKKPAEPEVSKKEAKAEITAEERTTKKTGKERHVVVIGTYAAKYAAEEAQEKLKGKGIRSSSKEVKKKLPVNRIFVKEVTKKEEVMALLSELKGKGYEPFSIPANGVYRVYAVSNMNEDIAMENKADLENLGYQPVIEKKVVDTKVYELVVRAKSAAEAKTLSAKLKKIGFKPEIHN